MSMPYKRTDPHSVPAKNAPTSAPGGPPWFLIGLIAAYLLLASAYNKLIPFMAGPTAAALITAHQIPVNPDEAAHVANAYRYKAGRIPVFRAGDPDFEAHQPPLYYVMIAPLLAPQTSHATQPARAARWLSIAIGALLLALVWAALRETFPERRAIADTAACICLLPTNINVCASISNDVLTNVVIAAAVWQLARIVRIVSAERSAGWQCFRLGILVALGIYTKTSTIVLFPAIAAAGWLLARRSIVSPAAAAKLVAIPCIVGLALAAPWLARNTLLYGDPAAQHIFNAAFSTTTATTAQMLSHFPPLFFLTWVIGWSFASFWAVFDGMRLFLPSSLYLVLALGAVVQAFGAARWVRGSMLTSAQMITLAAMATIAGATLLAFARFNTAFFQAQGRYLYPGLTFFGFVLAAGTLGWIVRANSGDHLEEPTVYKLVPYVTALVLLILNAVSLYTLHSAFPTA